MLMVRRAPPLRAARSLPRSRSAEDSGPPAALQKNGGVCGEIPFAAPSAGGRRRLEGMPRLPAPRHAVSARCRAVKVSPAVRAYSAAYSAGTVSRVYRVRSASALCPVAKLNTAPGRTVISMAPTLWMKRMAA